ncbi:hypothetical protein BGX26_006011 [Mortierella sp. AD094]|nr:hypothetical protein BGX26_006011 [Mortierella sp. AD094]
MSRNHLPSSNVPSRAVLLLALIQELEASSRRKTSPCICRFPSLLGGDCYGGARKKKSETCNISEPPTSHSNSSFQSASQGQLCDDHHGGPNSEFQNEIEISSRSSGIDVGSPSTTIDSSESPTATEEEEEEEEEEEDGDDDEEEEGEEEDGEDEFHGMSKAQILRRMKLEIERRKFLEKERRERSRALLKPASYLWTTNPRNERDNRPSLTTYETMVLVNAATALHMKGTATVTLNTVDQASGYIESNFSSSGGSCNGMDRGQPTTTTLFPHVPLRPLPPTPCRYLRNKLSAMTFFPARSDTLSDGSGLSRSSDASL